MENQPEPENKENKDITDNINNNIVFKSDRKDIDINKSQELLKEEKGNNVIININEVVELKENDDLEKNEIKDKKEDEKKTEIFDNELLIENDNNKEEIKKDEIIIINQESENIGNDKNAIEQNLEIKTDNLENDVNANEDISNDKTFSIFEEDKNKNDDEILKEEKRIEVININKGGEQKDNNQIEVNIKEGENNNEKEEIKKDAIEQNNKIKSNNLNINSNEGLSNDENKFSIFEKNDKNLLKENNQDLLKEEKIKEIININKIDERKEVDINKKEEDNKEIKLNIEKGDVNNNTKEIITVIKQDELILNKNNENEIKENPKIIEDNPKNDINKIEDSSDNDNKISIFEINENNLTEEKMCQRTDNINNDNKIKELKNDNNEVKEQNKNEIIINEIKEEKITLDQDKIIEDNFDPKDMEKIIEYNKSNYKDFYFKNHFCDYFTGKEWRSGYIKNISKDFIEIFDSIGITSSDPVTLQIKIEDFNKISYFRKYSSPNGEMVKGTSKNLNNKLLQFTNFHKNFKEYLEYCDSFEFYYFLRATVFYGLDICMDIDIDNKNVETSFRLILIILNIICDSLKFIKENFDDFFKYQNEIKQTQFKDLVLINKKYAIYSFFDDIFFLIKKIFGESPQSLEWYIKNTTELQNIIPSSDKILNPFNNSELFPLYEGTKKGEDSVKVLKRNCIKEAYKNDYLYYTLDKKMNSYIIVYLIDYFEYLEGFDTLFSLMCSIKYTKDNLFTSSNIQNQINGMLLTAKAITDSFSFYNAKKEENQELKGNEKVIDYIDNYICGLNLNDDEKSKSKNKNKNYYKDNDIDEIINKLVFLIRKNADEGSILIQGFYIKDVLKQLKEVKKFEKSISLLSKLNNIIKGVEYYTLEKEIKEKKNKDYNELMLKDSKFNGKDSNIYEITGEFFCEICKDNNIIELFLENKTTHEEVIKRIYPLLSIMYLNNFGYKTNNKEEKKIDSKYIFDALFLKLKESEQNNESMWKIILNDIILKFTDILHKEDKIYIFDLINKYYENTATKKSSKILQLITFIIDYSEKCITSNEAKDKENVPDLSDLVQIEKKDEKNKFDTYLKGQFNPEKYFCLDLIINFLISNDKINELQIDDDLKKKVIENVLDGIIKIIEKNKNNENIKLIIFIKIIEGIISSINTINNISLIKKLIELKLNPDTKKEIKLYCQQNKIIFRLLQEFFSYLDTILKEDKNNKKEIEERLDLIFLLAENEVEISNDDYNKLFDIKKYETFIKKIIYDKIKENILKIKLESQKYILDNILLKNNSLCDINDLLSYKIYKQFIFQINKSFGNFIFILDDNKELEEKYLIVKTKNEFKDLYGYNSLWNILLSTENNDIKNDISSFLTYIFLGTRFLHSLDYTRLCNSLIIKIYGLLMDNQNLRENGNIIRIKGLVILLKKILDESNFYGEIIDKKIIEKIINPLKPKENNKPKETSKQKEQKEPDIKIEKTNNPTPTLKINLKYRLSENQEQNEILTDLCEIYPSEFFYHLRYYISYIFQIPLRCVQIKKYEQNQVTKIYNLFKDTENIYDYINNKKKKKDEIDTFLVEKIKNPLCDDTKDNLRKLILNNSQLTDVLKKLLKEKDIDFVNDIFYIIKDKVQQDNNLGDKGFKIINDIITNYNKENNGLLNELFNFNESNLFFMNHILSNINDFIKSKDKKEDILRKFIKSPLWTKKLKNFEIKSNEKLNIPISELYDEKNYEFNLLKIYQKIITEKTLTEEDLTIITNNIIIMLQNFIYVCINIHINFSQAPNEEEKNKLNNLKKIFYYFFRYIKDIFTGNSNIYKKFLALLLKENNLKEKLKFFFLDGIIRNYYPLYSEQIAVIFLSLIKEENKDININNMQQEFYLNICQIFFTKENKEDLIKIFYDLSNSSKLIILTYINRFEYNSKVYFKTISEVFVKIYKLIPNQFNFENYIQDVVISSIFNPFLNSINQESNFHDYFFGGQCQILFYYLDNIDKNKFNNIEYHKGKNIKEYLYDEYIMNNSEKNNNKKSSPYTTSQRSFRPIHSFDSLSHLFIAFLIKDEFFSGDKPKEESEIIQRKGVLHYLDELNNLHLNNFSKGNQASDWRIYFQEQNDSNIFIGLKNLGCTCYMNSIFQVFYNIPLFRESILKCKCTTVEKNSLYELQKVFFNLKYLKSGYYTPDSFANNYDNEKLNPHQQMDVDEFFSNLLDKIENRIKDSDNENLIKYFFQGKLNDKLTFQEGCNHHRTKITNFYSIQLQVMNKKNIYESLDTLTEGELMNGDNCIFCPECNKKFPAIKSQSFNKLPRILMFVLKRFEFDYDKMAKIKINDYYEFPTELDMSKYIENNKDNRYELKSVVVHIGHSEGGHYYAYIKDDKTKTWHQFNDTSVTRFNINDLEKETFGGKEEGSKENKTRSAYLLFYEKKDQKDCEKFDKIKILNKLKNLMDNNIKNKIKEIKPEKKEDNIEINIIQENKENIEDNINNENINNENNKEIVMEEKDEDLIDMGGEDAKGKKLLQEIEEKTKIDYLKQLLFSSHYQLFTLELFLNVINSIDNQNNLPVFLKNFSFIKFDHHFQDEDILFRDVRPNISNIERYITKGKIKLLKLENKKYQNEEIKNKLIEIFKCLLKEFFNIIIRSREKKYFGCFVELIKYLINQYDFCAEYFLEEMSCYNTLIDYLLNCPMYDIKKVLVGLIYYAMLKSEQSYTKEKREQTNKTNPKLSDEEIAKKLDKEINAVAKDKDKIGDESLLKQDISTPSVLRLVYNVVFLLRKIKFLKFNNEARFLLEILLKFSLISQENRKFLVTSVNMLLPLNINLAQKHRQKDYTFQEIYQFDKGEFKPPHEILNPEPGTIIEGDADKTGKYITLDYDFMLLCNLYFFKEKKKEEIKKNNEDIGFTLYNGNYFFTLIKYCKTKQDIKYFSKLISFKCSEDKNIFDLVVKYLLEILDIIKDLEGNYFDESDPESEPEIYKNTGQNSNESNGKTLKKNISVIFRKLIMEAKNDKFGEYKIKTIASKLFSYFGKNKKYYSKAIVAVNIILNIFETSKIDSKKYLKDLNDILNWLNKYKIAPKYYEIKGINMYRDLPSVYHMKDLGKEKKIEFEKKEIENTNKKINRMKLILANKSNEYNIANFDGDLSDFKFTFDDVVLYQNKEYVVINCLDEMIRVKLVENNNTKEWEDITLDKKTNKKKMTLSEKEKIKFWIETDNYQLKVKSLVDILSKK